MIFQQVSSASRTLKPDKFHTPFFRREIKQVSYSEIRQVSPHTINSIILGKSDVILIRENRKSSIIQNRSVDKQRKNNACMSVKQAKNRLNFLLKIRIKLEKPLLGEKHRLKHRKNTDRPAVKQRNNSDKNARKTPIFTTQ